MNDLQRYIAMSRYARWIEEENRRETWEESVTRYVNFLYAKIKTTKISKTDLHEAYLILGASCEE